MIVDKLFRRVRNDTAGDNLLTLGDPAGWRLMNVGGAPSADAALKLSAVFRSVDGISNSVAKLPLYLMDETTKERLPDHPLTPLLTERPNEVMTAFSFKKLLETERLLSGNGYAWINRDPVSFAPVELIPLPSHSVTPRLDEAGRLWYDAYIPSLKKVYVLPQLDVLHVKGFSRDGITGISVLQYAAEVIEAGRAAQQYERDFYRKGTQVPGVLSTDEADLSPEQRDAVRSEWERVHSGVDNAFRVAVLDRSLKYQPIGLSNRDSQFVESKAVSVEDIGRFFGMPLYKLNAGKQSYDSNEQNSIEYVNDTMIPILTQYEQEYSYKLLFSHERAARQCIRVNHNAELRGALINRGAWYKSMRETGAFSVNDIRALEDMPDVPGGDTHYASLNYVPLEDFADLSQRRNRGGEPTK